MLIVQRPAAGHRSLQRDVLIAFMEATILPGVPNQFYERRTNRMKESTRLPRPSATKRHKPEAGGSNGKEQIANIRLATYCRALAQPVRVRILKLLINEHCMFSDLSRRIPLAQSTISQHLKILAAAGLVEAATVGQSTCYCIKEKEIKGLKKLFADL